MSIEVRLPLIILALLGSVSLAHAQAQRPDNPNHSTQEPSTNSAPGSPTAGVFVDGRLAVPGAPDGDTVPSKFSEKNAADDKLPILGYTFKYLTDEQRHAIYQGVKTTDAAAAKTEPQIGEALSITIAFAPFPTDLDGQVPGLTRYRFIKSGDRLVLVNPANRTVVGIIAPN
jgi:hypothetical protein